jgi:hypothetical protein
MADPQRKKRSATTDAGAHAEGSARLKQRRLFVGLEEEEEGEEGQQEGDEDDGEDELFSVAVQQKMRGRAGASGG